MSTSYRHYYLLFTRKWGPINVHTGPDDQFRRGHNTSKGLTAQNIVYHVSLTIILAALIFKRHAFTALPLRVEMLQRSLSLDGFLLVVHHKVDGRIRADYLRFVSAGGRRRGIRIRHIGPHGSLSCVKSREAIVEDIVHSLAHFDNARVEEFLFCHDAPAGQFSRT